MASSLPLFLFLLSLLLTTVASIPDSDLQLMLSALRSRGYNLFGNSIIISDIHHDLLQGPSFTLFVPTDGSLFSLEINSSPSLYLSTLRYHIVSGKYSASDLLALTPGTALPTLLPHHYLTIGTEILPSQEILKADGVDVAVPGLYYSRNIAVHGLNGILDHRHLHPHQGSFSPDLEQISPEPQSSSDLKPSQPEILSPYNQSPADTPISAAAADSDLDDYLPGSRASSPETMYPLLKSPDALTPEYGEEMAATWMPAFSSAPESQSQSRQQGQCSDSSEVCGELQPELVESDRFEAESRCGMMMQDGIPATSPAFSQASRKINGRDL